MNIVTEAVVIEYDDGLFIISILENNKKTIIESIVGDLDDHWSRETAYDVAWNESYQRLDDLPILRVEPCGTWIWKSNSLIPGPRHVEEDKLDIDDIPF